MTRGGKQEGSGTRGWRSWVLSANLYRLEYSTNREGTERRWREWETTRGGRRLSGALYFLRGRVQGRTRVWRREGYSSAGAFSERPARGDVDTTTYEGLTGSYVRVVDLWIKKGTRGACLKGFIKAGDATSENDGCGERGGFGLKRAGLVLGRCMEDTWRGCVL